MQLCQIYCCIANIAAAMLAHVIPHSKFAPNPLPLIAKIVPPKQWERMALPSLPTLFLSSRAPSCPCFLITFSSRAPSCPCSLIPSYLARTLIPRALSFFLSSLSSCASSCLSSCSHSHPRHLARPLSLTFRAPSVTLSRSVCLVPLSTEKPLRPPRSLRPPHSTSSTSFHLCTPNTTPRLLTSKRTCIPGQRSHQGV